MLMRILKPYVVLLLCGGVSAGFGQTWSVHGQASAWLMSHIEEPSLTQSGLRYLPELSLTEDLGGGITGDLDLVMNGKATASFAKSQQPQFDGTARLYRAWMRIASEKLEFRAGLQKLNFGSATLFRPLMWFDSVDPRDPLQLTNGVYGLLARYYFLDNANIWLWGLYGNSEAKGWEVVPTTEKSFEYGGRVQIPAWTGEVGATYHHREADFTHLLTLTLYATKARTSEDRFALDGKWNIGIGAWFEAALTHDQTDLPYRKYQRQWTLGGDYTFDIGNGLNALTEYFRSDNPDAPFANANGSRFSALSLNYPLGLIDRVSCILYRDWSNQEWYRLITWQRTYDNWMFYLLGFWNPKDVGLYGIPAMNTSAQSVANPFAGTGIQLMLVFNH
ncbi:MAG: hypothetical protein NTZ35_04985 [Ignavibacteriales bacterium]|nr:hypothetical protein [Ignavibacteriales bacterium]